MSLGLVMMLVVVLSRDVRIGKRHRRTRVGVSKRAWWARCEALLVVMMAPFVKLWPSIGRGPWWWCRGLVQTSGVDSGLGIVEKRGGRRAGIRGVIRVVGSLLRPCCRKGIQVVVAGSKGVVVRAAPVVLRAGRHGGGRLTGYHFTRRVGRP